MTRQEIAVARSHIEVWKCIANGPERHVLVLEDDVYFVRGAASLIDRGWRAAVRSGNTLDRPHLLYLSYKDAGGTAQRTGTSPRPVGPVRGFWYMSGYVLSRGGATSLLGSMPVVGPVDLWMNRRFAELDVLALARPALLQRLDGGSDNAYSILTYLSARAWWMQDPVPYARPRGPTVSCSRGMRRWTDVMGMALSMLGHRVRSCRNDVLASDFFAILDGGEPLFDAYVDANLDQRTLSTILERRPDARFVVMTADEQSVGLAIVGGDSADRSLPPDRTLILRLNGVDAHRWEPLCGFLCFGIPDSAFPIGVDHAVGLFQADGHRKEHANSEVPRVSAHDDQHGYSHSGKLAT